MRNVVKQYNNIKASWFKFEQTSEFVPESPETERRPPKIDFAN